jgi:site-specific DNA recombinase
MAKKASKERHQKKGVSYIRVSDPKQVKRDFNPEGYSLPQQRQAVKAKADSIDADIEKEFKEEGRSAKTVDQRPEFQAMLAYIKEQGDIDYVIFDSLSRANRNRVEDAMMLMALRAAGVEAVSATEPIDSTPAGQLLHGILASVHEFRVNADGNDIRRKMAFKASIGGTPGRAKIGYLNVHETFEGRRIATIAIDSERAPLVRLGFELYATGTYTLDTITEVLAAAGLTTRPFGDRPARPVVRSTVGRMLRDRYYIGYVKFGGNEYQGRHPKLIEPVLFHRVQEVMDSQSGAGLRSRKHTHYLKGALWCHRCGRRLVVAVAKGIYEYYFCVGRRDKSCDLPYLSATDLEQHVVEHYATVSFPADFQAVVEEAFAEQLDTAIASSSQIRDNINKRLGELSMKEDNYLELVGDPAWPKDKLTARMQAVRDERDKLLAQIDQLDADLSVAREIISAALTLLERPQRLYKACSDTQRKLLNATIFTKLAVDTDGVAGEELAEPFDVLVPLGRYYTHNGNLPTAAHPGEAKQAADGRQDDRDQLDHLAAVPAGHSSNKHDLVLPTGFEPALPP